MRCFGEDGADMRASARVGRGIYTVVTPPFKKPVAAERYTVHLRAICPEGAGRLPSRGARRAVNVMATLTLALVRCYGLFCRALPGHVADPATNSLPLAIATVLPVAELKASTRRGAIAT